MASGRLLRGHADLLFGGLHPELAERLSGIGVSVVQHQPPGGLGHLGPQCDGQYRRKRADAENEPPVEVASIIRQTHQEDHGHEIGHQDANGDHPLLDDAQLASPLTGGELRDIGGGDRGVGPDREPDERAGRQQHEGIHGECRQERADGVDGGVGDEQGLAPEMVGQRPGDESSRASAQGCAGHHITGPEAGQVVRNEVQRRADVGGVVSEEEPADAGQHSQVPVEGRRDP
jgi:hypothetical protein